MKKFITIFAFISALSTAYAGGYGMAGCGIGALAFGDEPGMIQIVAATLNNILIPQTSAITSGTSNCTEDGVAISDKEQLMFVEANYESLIQEMAQGHGEHLSAFATLFGCEQAQVEEFSNIMHQNFSTIQTSDEAEALNSIREVYDSNFSGSCQDNG